MYEGAMSDGWPGAGSLDLVRTQASAGHDRASPCPPPDPAQLDRLVADRVVGFVPREQRIDVAPQSLVAPARLAQECRTGTTFRRERPVVDPRDLLPPFRRHAPGSDAKTPPNI
jgi:hypothetical protein